MGIASVTHPSGDLTFRFRTNPNQITWNYNLNTKVEETYGGRVVQILSANIDSLTVTADCGRGGWEYMEQVALFFRDMLVAQKDTGGVGYFEYPNRGWKFAVYALSFPFKDNRNDVAREFTMNFKVQEDVSGVATADTLKTELEKLKQGIGYVKNEYNTPAGTTDKPADNAAAPPADPNAPQQAQPDPGTGGAGPSSTSPNSGTGKF
jgi:hypothetical protein